MELKKCERRAALHLPLSAATSPEGAAEPEPESEPRPSPRLTAALNEAADLPAKLLFLERLGLRPAAAAAGELAATGAAPPAARTGASSSGSGTSGAGSPPAAASGPSGTGSPPQRKPGELTPETSRRTAKWHACGSLTVLMLSVSLYAD